MLSNAEISTVARIGTVVVFGVLAAISSTAEAQEATGPVRVEAPATVVVGAEVEIRWTGEVEEQDFISIDEAGAPESAYGNYIYPSRGEPGKLPAPEFPGAYAVRYHSGAGGYPVRGSSPLEVVDATAVIEGPGSVVSGAQVEFAWTGPAHERDFISIDPEGSDDRTYGPYVYATLNPGVIRAPERPGAYLIRYHLASSYRVIGSTGLTVVLLTDGEETCDGDPRAAIEELGRAGFDVRVNIVGFAINELELKETFESVPPLN